MGTGHFREGDRINGRSGEWQFISGHADRAKHPGNLANTGLPAAVQETIKAIPNDCGDKSRKKTLLGVMAAGGTLKVDVARKEPK